MAKVNEMGLDVGATLLKGNADTTLRHEEYVRYDQALIDVARARRSVFTDLLMKGLRKSVSIGTTLSSL